MSLIKLPQLEIDVYTKSELQAATDLCITHSCSAIVIPPELCFDAQVARGIRNGKFKIIVAIDAPDGQRFENLKFIGIPQNSLNADGYEIALTPNRSENETLKEIAFIDNMHKSFFGQMVEFRYVIGMHQKNHTTNGLKTTCNAIKSRPLPKYIRTSWLTTLPINAKQSLTTHNDDINMIRQLCGAPIKISGNINMDSIEKIRVQAFAVTLDQAKNIVAEMQQYLNAQNKQQANTTSKAMHANV